MYNCMGTKERPYDKYEYNNEDFKKYITDYMKDSTFEVKRKKTGEYWMLDTICSFDTETSNTRVPFATACKYDRAFMFNFDKSNDQAQEEMDNGVKFAFVYIWQIAFGKDVWYGRYLYEFVDCINILKSVVCNISPLCRMIIWVHNFAFDWSFIKTLFKWDSDGYLFIKPSKILYARTGNIEFRCSFLLSGVSLGNIGDFIDNEIYKKKIGDLDYSKVRLPITKLTDAELEYCFYDVLTMNSYIIDFIKREGYSGLLEMPYTKTGLVRNLIKEDTIYSNDKHKKFAYKDRLKQLNLCRNEYRMLKEAYQGGFTHANANYVNKVVRVKAFDIASSYPFVLTTQKFPSKFIQYFIDPGEIMNIITTHACAWVFEIIFINVKSKFDGDHLWSISKCDQSSVSNEVVDNGRIVSCSYMKTVMNDVDLELFNKCYEYDDYKILSGYQYEYDYLPKEFVLSVLKFYNGKSKIKGDDTQKAKYNVEKSKTNSTYGVSGQDPIKPKLVLNDNLEVDIIDIDDNNIDELIRQYNNSYSRVTSYTWAPWVTSYARYRLWELILLDGSNHVYSDTDSEKVIPYEGLIENVRKLNNKTLMQIEKASLDLGIDINLYKPKSADGKDQIIGLWDDEGDFELKTIGAKRYMTWNINKKKWEITVSGVNKDKAMKWFIKQGEILGKSPFDLFQTSYTFPAESGVNVQHTDSKHYSLHTCLVTDDFGNSEVIVSPSWKHLEAHSYDMNISREFDEYLRSKDFEYVLKS